MIIYYNSRCSKCREALGLMEEAKCQIEIREYLKEAPSVKELKLLLNQLGCKAMDIVRRSEPLFKENYSDKKFSDAQWIKILSKNPILIERPIIIDGDKAVIGRPVERVIEWMDTYKKR